MYSVFAALAVFVCAGFTASASWALLAFYAVSGDEGGPSIPRLGAKAAAFSIVFLASIVGLFVLRTHRPDFTAVRPAPLPVWDRRALLPLALVVLIAAAASGLRLRAYPHVEPDEAHHLVVARNIAVHGVYGSGMPATGFRRFDDYDSVGPTVLLPVAAAIRVFGDPLLGGRAAMAAVFVLLSIVVYRFMSQAASPAAGVGAAVFMLLAPGSLYLARTLYGEAPALAYLVAALLMWNRALASPRPIALCAVSGLLFGCALVTKYFLVVAVWPALGMWVYDTMTHRRIRPVHALVPAVVALATLASWIAVTSRYGPQGSGTAAGHVSMYQHNLLFGLHSLDTTLGWLADHWIATLLYLALGLLCAAPAAMVTAYSPAFLFLLCFAVLNTYWWVFFTTGTIPRYLWFGMAIGAACTGRALATGCGARPTALRVAAFATVSLLAAWDAAPRVYGMLTRDEMRDEFGLIETLQRDYAGKRLATTFYPVERIVNLLAEIPAPWLHVSEPWTEYDAVIVDRTSQPDAAKGAVANVGRYAIVEMGKGPT